MNRRDLLGLACSPFLVAAGCLSEQTCTDASISNARLSVEYWCDSGQVSQGRVSGSAEECNEALTLEIVDGGEVVSEIPTEPDERGLWSVDLTGWAPSSVREGTVRVRDPDGEVRAKKSLSVNHYLDNTDLDVADASFEPETVAVGESVTVTFGVATFGGDAAFTAGLLVDGEAVDTREGTIDGGADCVGFSGPEYEFTRAFDEPGEYDLAGQIEVEKSLSAGDRESIGTVTVTE